MDAKAAARAELIREREAGMWTDDDGFAIRPDKDSTDPEG
jgi:GTP-binding protein